MRRAAVIVYTVQIQGVSVVVVVEAAPRMLVEVMVMVVGLALVMRPLCGSPSGY